MMIKRATARSPSSEVIRSLPVADGRGGNFGPGWTAGPESVIGRPPGMAHCVGPAAARRSEIGSNR